MKPIPYGTQYIDENDINAVASALKAAWLTQGPFGAEFEQTVAQYHNCAYAVAFSSGTAALHGAYYASGISLGDEFITTPITFAASANAGLYMGAKPVFADISLDTYNIDLENVAKAVSSKTKVITPVSYAGNPVDIRAFKEKFKNITIIHDAAHAIGAKIHGDNIADYADMTILSFHPVKHVTTCEGGMVLTNNSDFYKKLTLFRSHGITKDPEYLSANEGPWYYEMLDLGYNYRLTDVQSALGISQMKKLDASIKRRNEIARKYNRELGGLDWLTIPKYDLDQPGYLNSFHLYPLLINNADKRLEFFNYLRENELNIQVHYIPVPDLPYYRKNFGFKPEDFPNAEYFYAREVSLPMFPTLMDEQQEYVIKTIKGFKL